MTANSKKSPPTLFLRDFSEQAEARQFLWQAHQTDRVASTYLFAGPAGVGKFLAALEFAKFLKCQNISDGGPCDNCRSCRTAASWDNPDVFIIFPMPSPVWLGKERAEARQQAYEEFRNEPHLRPSFSKPASVLLPMVHEVQRFLATSGTTDGGKFVLVPDAHKMNLQAANAFLKTLEEPPPDVHIILSTDRAEALLPTIRSRAQLVRFRRLAAGDVARHLVENYSFPPERAAIIAALAEGSIATALKLASDEFQRIREQAIALIGSASEGNLLAIWEWASSAPGQIDYAQAAMMAFASLARDIVVATSAGGHILNADAAEAIERAAKRIASPFAALEFLREIHTLQMNIERNPQYSLFFGAVAAAIAETFS